MEEDYTTIQGQLIDPEIHNFVLVLRAHPTVDNILSAELDCLLEVVIWKPSVVRPVSAGPNTVGGSQALVGLLEPKGFLI